MFRNNQFRILFSIVVFLLSAIINAQRIENVYPEIEGEKVHIYYDLLGIGTDQAVIVKAYLSTDGGETYGEPLKSVTGDVGWVTGPGKNRCIIWDVFEDRDELVSVNVRFKVRAEPIQTGQASLSANRVFKLNLNTNLGTKNIIDYNSFGLNIKGTIYFNQLGLGLRADYYRTFRKDIDYSYNSSVLPDTGYYWGYSGGAIIEYDFIKSEKYSFYPFLFIGQSKIIYQYNPDYMQEDYFKYSVFGSLGLGFDIKVYRVLYLGLELEYMVSPWVDIIPSSEPDESLDGFHAGFVIKFLID